jgi:hypothetical protein
VVVLIVTGFPEWQVKIMDILKSCFDAKTNKFSGKEMGLISAAGIDMKKDKKIMPFISTIKVLHHLSNHPFREQRWILEKVL